jgi:hypothetical protein
MHISVEGARWLEAKAKANADVHADVNANTN